MDHVTGVLTIMSQQKYYPHIRLDFGGASSLDGQNV